MRCVLLGRLRGVALGRVPPNSGQQPAETRRDETTAWKNSKPTPRLLFFFFFLLGGFFLLLAGVLVAPPPPLLVTHATNSFSPPRSNTR